MAKHAAALQPVPSPDSAPSPPGSPDVMFVAANEVIRDTANALEEV